MPTVHIEGSPVTAEPVPRDWWDALAEQSWPHGQQLTERQIDRINDLAESLDMNNLVEDFCDYWLLGFQTIAPSRLKTWVLSMRLRTFVRNALKRQPSADNRSDDYLRRVLAEQKARGNQ